MSTTVQNSIETSTTTLNTWKKLFSATANGGRSAAKVRSYTANSQDLWLCVVPAGATAPTEPADESQVSYRVSPGDTYDLGPNSDYRNDVYIRAADGSVQSYRAWEAVG